MEESIAERIRRRLKLKQLGLKGKRYEDARKCRSLDDFQVTPEERRED